MTTASGRSSRSDALFAKCCLKLADRIEFPNEVLTLSFAHQSLCLGALLGVSLLTRQPHLLSKSEDYFEQEES